MVLFNNKNAILPKLPFYFSREHRYGQFHLPLGLRHLGIDIVDFPCDELDAEEDIVLEIVEDNEDGAAPDGEDVYLLILMLALLVGTVFFCRRMRQ